MAKSPKIGQKLGRYRIVELVGEGGMGVVYRAHDEELDRDVAVKILPQLGLLSEPARKQFRREALTLARITDPNVAMAFDFGHDDGIDYLVTEYVPGITLNARIAGRPLSEGEILHLGKQLASGLESAHRQGVIHRDLKPSNLRVTPDGHLKILDFGLAFLRQTEAASTVTAPLTGSYDHAGTLPYMSPEQIKGDKPDARADIWSAGAVLYEMSTGKSPFADSPGPALVAAILEQPPPAPRTLNPKVSEGLEQIILRALQKDPAERYQSAGDLRIDLSHLATGTMPLAPKPVAVRPWRWYAIVLFAILAVAGLVWKRRALPSAVVGEQVMAVLPFESVASDAPTNALGRGLSETLTAKLVQASDGGHLQLVSTRDLVAQGVKTVEQARQEFGTDLVLEGSLQQYGKQIRITCSLVNARTHLQLAARTVTGAADDIFQLQDNLVDRVVEMLPTEVGENQHGVLATAADTKPAAYDYYLRGRGYLEDYQNLENIENAIAEFERALAVDANYAPAHAAMGMAYTIGFQQKNRGKDWLDKARKECERALAITPQLAEGHSCLGSVDFSTGRYEQAVQRFERSLELDHTNDEALRLLAAADQKLGQIPAAEEAYRKAIALRPKYWGVYSGFGTFYYNQARYADAAAMFRQAIQLAPENYLGYSNLGGTYLYLGQYEAGVDSLKKSIALRPTFDAYGNLSFAYFYLRRYEDSASTLRQAMTIDDKDWQNWGSLGDTLYQLPAQRTEALSAYRKAIDLATARLEVNSRDAVALACTADYYGLLGEEQQAKSRLAQALAIGPDDPEVLFRASLFYNHIGNAEATLSSLNKAANAGYPRALIRDTPDFEPLHTDPRFRALLPP